MKLKLSTPYEGKDGIVRYVIFQIKLGRGYTIHWDTVCPGPDYWKLSEAKAQRTKNGLAGYMPMAKFVKLTINSST